MNLFLIKKQKNGYVKYNIIAQINEPISIVSIVGKYRTGKSYLLNKVLL
jgi:GTPase Era involved in 16S rRNA processing